MMIAQENDPAIVEYFDAEADLRRIYKLREARYDRLTDELLAAVYDAQQRFKAALRELIKGGG